MDTSRLRRDAQAIQAAALEAVMPERLVARRLQLAAGRLLLDGRLLDPPLEIPGRGRIAIVGGGKAAAGVAAGVVTMLRQAGVAADQISGLLSVPAGCSRPVPGVEVRETRPAAINLPTLAAVEATRDMLAVVGSLAASDLAVAVITGGGSAALEQPRAGVTLDELIAVAQHLSAAGASIADLNLVRQAGSNLKGGGLARACRAGRLLVIVLSDVIGDPLEVIASGPCLPVAGTATAALEVLTRFGVIATGAAPNLVAALQRDAAGDDNERRPASSGAASSAPTGSWTTPAGCQVDHVLLGGNATAVEAAAAVAGGLGYAVATRPAGAEDRETADEVGRRLAWEGREFAAEAAADGQPRARVEGGEAVVHVPSDHGRGGRNQQTAVAALAASEATGLGWPAGLLITSIGTDGEDGPTEAAGGMIDAAVAASASEQHLDAAAAAARCDAWSLLEACGGLLITGPTGTNVADLRLVLCRP